MPSPTPAKALISSAELEAYLRVHAGWAAKARLSGEGPPFVKLGRAVRYDTQAVDAWLVARSQRSTAEGAL